MREIKFRCWSKRYSKMWEWEVDDVKQFDTDKELRNPDSILLQFTGLKDKNGVEIWEGDIISFGPWSDGKGECLHEVRWSKSECGFKTYEPTEKLKYSIDSHMGEVVGNIYENPELLEPR